VKTNSEPNSIAIYHGAGYVGREIIRLLSSHEGVSLDHVSSRSFADRPVWKAHPEFRGHIQTSFCTDDEIDLQKTDVVFIAAEHGKGVEVVLRLIERGYSGCIVDMTADFRFRDPDMYPTWFGFEHPAPNLLSEFAYGLPEVNSPYPDGTRWVANPGCFATAVTLALWPPAKNLTTLDASVTALTGASGSGSQPKVTTHYPTREGNVRAYRVFKHQHQPEILQALGPQTSISFVPVSGPWTLGIWGTAHLRLPQEVGTSDVAAWYERTYESAPFVRIWPGALPELRFSVGTPFCDIGWVIEDNNLVVGFAIDNLVKGAAGQAVQNMNLLLGLPETMGLI